MRVRRNWRERSFRADVVFGDEKAGERATCVRKKAESSTGTRLDGRRSGGVGTLGGRGGGGLPVHAPGPPGTACRPGRAEGGTATCCTTVIPYFVGVSGKVRRVKKCRIVKEGANGTVGPEDVHYPRIKV